MTQLKYEREYVNLALKAQLACYGYVINYGATKNFKRNIYIYTREAFKTIKKNNSYEKCSFLCTYLYFNINETTLLEYENKALRQAIDSLISAI